MYIYINRVSGLGFIRFKQCVFPPCISKAAQQCLEKLLMRWQVTCLARAAVPRDERSQCNRTHLSCCSLTFSLCFFSASACLLREVCETWSSFNCFSDASSLGTRTGDRDKKIKCFSQCKQFLKERFMTYQAIGHRVQLQLQATAWL